MATQVFGPLKALMERFGEWRFDELELQRLVEHADILRAIGIGALTREQLAGKVLSPHTKQIVKPTRTYPPNFQFKSWQEQAEILTAVYPELSTSGLAEMAALWPNDHAVWTQESVHPKSGETIRHFDGLVVFPSPGKAALKLGIGDVWVDIKRGVKGKGLWGRLCEEVLFSRLEPKFPVPLYNYRKGEMGSDRFLPEDVLVSWFQKIEGSIEGDFAIRPLGFGKRLAGYSVQASRWEIENIISGIPCPTWIAGNALLTHPDRLPGYGHLWLDMPGDRYRFEDSRGFGGAPCFRRGDDKLLFHANQVSVADDGYGSVVLAR